jgi:hypothetical protein
MFCSSRHGVGGAATMEWGERVTAVMAEKKRANSGGALEAPATAMRNEETMHRSLFYFCMRAKSGLWAGPVGQLAVYDTG